MTTAQIITIASEDMLLSDAIALAEKAGMTLISNGRRAVISPVILNGWHKIGVNAKPLPIKKKA
ncbi:MAG: hypothetical protein ABTQ26_00330 [Azonexus sp.]